MITNPHKTSHQYLRKLLVLPLAALLVTLFAFSYRQKQSGPPLNENGLPEQSSLFASDTIPAGSLLVEEVRADVGATGKGVTVTEKQTPSPSLIIFNGKEYTRDQFSRMTGDQERDVVIESRHVVSTNANNASAIAKYGEKARDGVLEFKEARIDTTGPKKAPVRITLSNTTPDNEPLVILDGIEQERNSLKLVLRDLNPNEIKSITVLKDSSATSLYGSKGEHGVLVISTKEKIVGVLTPKLEEVTVVGYGTKRVLGVQLSKVSEDRSISNRQAARTDQELREVTVVGYPSRKADSLRSVKVTGQVTGVLISPSSPKVENQKLEAVTINAVNNLAIVYPNPASNTVSLKLNVDKDGDVIIRILDMSGKERSRTRATLIKGANTTSVSTGDLTPGTYIIRVDGQEQNLHTSVKLLKE